jgi:hypothetical protein
MPRRWATAGVLGTTITVALASALLGVGVSAGASAESVANTRNQTPSTTPSVAVRSVDDAFEGVTCTHLTSCWAVGFAGRDPSHGGTLAERWNRHHHAFRRVATPNPAGMEETGFNGVSCARSTSCIAVGAGVTPALARSAVAEHWNGHHWAITSLPLSEREPGSTLQSVSCPTRSYCFAVGSYSTDASAGETAALILKWNGSAWSIAASPGGFTSSDLNGVSCTSTTHCLAVGDRGSVIGHPLTERWNGTTWAVVTPTNHVHSESVQLASVACPVATSCLAVGNYFNSASLERTFDERWTSTTGATVGKPKNPSPPHITQLIGVACPSASHCLAVGNEPKAGIHVRSLAERWNGSSWKILATPDVGSSVSLTLFDVSCLNASDCFAVGDNAGHPPTITTLAERWNGHHWTAVTAQNP